MSIILGIDPGFRKTGYGVIQECSGKAYYLTSGCIFPKGSLATLFKEVQALIEEYKPTEAAIEQIFFHRNARSALVLGQARSMALLAFELAGMNIKDYAARHIKQSITGYGAANKVQMQMMIQQLLHLSSTPSEDAADALGLALCHMHHAHSIINKLEKAV